MSPFAPAISNDGRYVAFSSRKSDLVPGDTNGAGRDVFRHDLVTSTTILVSVGAIGQQSPSGINVQPTMSRDGRYVGFVALEPLVPEDLNAFTDVFVRDVATGQTTRVSPVSRGGDGNGQSRTPVLSGDGRYVAFTSLATNLMVGDHNGFEDVFIHDRMTGVTRLVSSSAAGIHGDHSSGGLPSLSDDGAFVAFRSNARNLLPTLDTDGFTFEDIFVSEWQALPAEPNTNLLRNITFLEGLARWGTFALPNPSDIVVNTTGGVLQFYRAPGSAQAVVLQGTDARLPAFAPITAQFELGNSSAGRKRISVLIHDGDFSDLSVCTFWLDPVAPLLTYSMRTHTTKAWSNATISFYAATADGTPFYRVDNVSLMSTPAAADAGTDCTDPTTPPPVIGAPPGPTLMVNGNFATGLAPWGTFGQIVFQIAGGVFEFYRPPGAPAGVVLQSTGQPRLNDRKLTANFKLGNSTNLRRRVTVLLHDADFSDLSACTFWLPPNLPLTVYAMRMFTTKNWTNATLSVYAATIGADPWLRLDDVVLQETNGPAITGTHCIEPDLSEIAFGPAAEGARVLRPGLRQAQSVSNGSRQAGLKAAANSRGPASRWAGGPTDRYAQQFWLPPHDTPVAIQVSDDGETWVTVETYDASDEWTLVEIEAGQVVDVRYTTVR